MSDSPKKAWSQRHGGTAIAVLLVAALVLVMVLNAR
jgi:hypothetical protein